MDWHWFLTSKKQWEDSSNDWSYAKWWQQALWWWHGGFNPQQVHRRASLLELLRNVIDKLELVHMAKLWLANGQLRDFHNEVREVLALKDPTFQPEYMSCWKESVPDDPVHPMEASWWHLELACKNWMEFKLWQCVLLTFPYMGTWGRFGARWPATGKSIPGCPNLVNQ